GPAGAPRPQPFLRRRLRRRPAPDQPGADVLPLAVPAHHPPAQV
ncbi:MAG: hypothetical protein AVDCRST_MAG73-211, partial [uncultured Thermomicrobiales bacterium]